MNREEVAPHHHDPLVKDFSLLGSRIAILGGTFDPVHRGHLAMGEIVLAKLAPDAVVYIPAKHNPLKANPPIGSENQRIEMLRLALRENRKFFVSPIETLREGVSFTIDTLRSIKESAQPGAELFLICGADQIPTLHQWKELSGIFRIASPYVLGRNGIAPNDIEHLGSSLTTDQRRLLREQFIPFSMPVEATELRAALADKNRSKVESLLPSDVLAYIANHQLYRAHGCSKDRSS